jgi:hypothetical protein
MKYPRLYFTSWFLEQNYSLSGFIHIKATLNFNNLCQHINITQNNNTFQYSLKTYRSQDEEMSLMGALLYGSLVIHHEHLLLNTVKQMIKPFHSSIRSIEMIFVRSEHSKKEVGQRTPQQIYNAFLCPCNAQSRRGLFSMQTLFLIVSNVQVRRGLAKKVVPQFLELFKF